ncbi:MAG: PEP-CTERM sorting domain-containing protein [Halioglobus sp.]|nr:PEP-CTERM sorting domain-containing protein [Halioglobus sp.]
MKMFATATKRLGQASAILLASVLTVPVNAAVISLVGTRSELATIEQGFIAAGDTTTRYGDWSSLSAAQLNDIFMSDIVWEGDIFNGISNDVQSRMTNFVGSNGGLFLTAERPCCETHNAAIQQIGRDLTGDLGLLVGGLGFDVFDHVFSNSPTTILTDPFDIRNQPAQHNGPGRVQPTGGVNSDACFTVSNPGNPVCTAAAWGPDVLVDNMGRLVIYGDINSQPSLVNNFNSEQFLNIRSFLLAGFTGGEDTCDTNPNLPGCPTTDIPVPGTLALMSLGSLLLFWRRRRAA